MVLCPQCSSICRVFPLSPSGRTKSKFYTQQELRGDAASVKVIPVSKRDLSRTARVQRAQQKTRKKRTEQLEGLRFPKKSELDLSNLKKQFSIEEAYQRLNTLEQGQEGFHSLTWYIPSGNQMHSVERTNFTARFKEHIRNDKLCFRYERPEIDEGYLTSFQEDTYKEKKLESEKYSLRFCAIDLAIKKNGWSSTSPEYKSVFLTLLQTELLVDNKSKTITFRIVSFCKAQGSPIKNPAVIVYDTYKAILKTLFLDQPGLHPREWKTQMQLEIIRYPMYFYYKNQIYKGKRRTKEGEIVKETIFESDKKHDSILSFNLKNAQTKHLWKRRGNEEEDVDKTYTRALMDLKINEHVTDKYIWKSILQDYIQPRRKKMRTFQGKSSLLIEDLFDRPITDQTKYFPFKNIDSYEHSRFGVHVLRLRQQNKCTFDVFKDIFKLVLQNIYEEVPIPKSDDKFPADTLGEWFRADALIENVLKHLCEKQVEIKTEQDLEGVIEMFKREKTPEKKENSEWSKFKQDMLTDENIMVYIKNIPPPNHRTIGSDPILTLYLSGSLFVKINKNMQEKMNQTQTKLFGESGNNKIRDIGRPEAQFMMKTELVNVQDMLSLLMSKKDAFSFANRIPSQSQA